MLKLAGGAVTSRSPDLSLHFKLLQNAVVLTDLSERFALGLLQC